MRNLRVRREIDVFAIEHDPFAIGRRHRRADALQRHHVFECEGMFSVLSKSRSGQRENDCQKNFHEAQSFSRTPSGANTCLGSARLWRAGRRILRRRTFDRFENQSEWMKFRSCRSQNAIANTLQACAPQNTTLLAVRTNSVTFGAPW